MKDGELNAALHPRQLKLMGRLLPDHQRRLQGLERRVYPGYRFGWRVAEAPALVSPELFARDAEEMRRLLSPYFTDAFRDRYRDHVPQRFRRPDDSGWFPRFIATDYQRVWNRELDGFQWCVPEIQSFPANAFLKPAMLQACLADLPELAASDAFLHDGFSDAATYRSFLSDHVCRDHRPEDTVVLEIKPDEQVTRVDMLLTVRELGCRLVDLHDVTVDPASHEILYSRAVTFDGDHPRTVDFATPQVARNVLSRCVPDELDAELARKDTNITPDSLGALFQDTLTHGTADWVVHPQDFFVLSKATLVGNPHHFPPLRPVGSSLVCDLEQEGLDLADGVVKSAYGAGGRGLIGLDGSLDPNTLRDLISRGSPDLMNVPLWQQRYGADGFNRLDIDGYSPAGPDQRDPIYHELRIMWAARGNAHDADVILTPLCGLTRWSRIGVAANARHQTTPFTGTQGLLVAELD